MQRFFMSVATMAFSLVMASAPFAQESSPYELHKNAVGFRNDQQGALILNRAATQKDIEFRKKTAAPPQFFVDQTFTGDVTVQGGFAQYTINQARNITSITGNGNKVKQSGGAGDQAVGVAGNDIVYWRKVVANPTCPGNCPAN